MRINFKNYDNCWLTQTLKYLESRNNSEFTSFLCIFFLIFKNLKIVIFFSKGLRKKQCFNPFQNLDIQDFRPHRNQVLCLTVNTVFSSYSWHHNPHGISHSAIFEFSSYPFQRPRKIKIDTIDLDITRDQGGRGDDSPRIPLPCTEVGCYRSFSAANCLSMSSSVTRDFDVSPRPLLGAAGACTICNEINGFLDMYSKLRSGYSYFDIIYTCIVFSFFLYCIFCKIIVHVKM